MKHPNLFAVSKYMDQIRLKSEKDRTEDNWHGTPQYLYFPDEEKARQFIVMRAKGRVANAENELQQAKAKYRMVVQKFGDGIES